MRAKTLPLPELRRSLFADQIIFHANRFGVAPPRQQHKPLPGFSPHGTDSGGPDYRGDGSLLAVPALGRSAAARRKP